MLNTAIKNLLQYNCEIGRIQCMYACFADIAPGDTCNYIYILGALTIEYPCTHARVYICTCIIFQFSKSNLLISSKTTDTQHKYTCNNELGRNGMQTLKN